MAVWTPTVRKPSVTAGAPKRRTQPSARFTAGHLDRPAVKRAEGWVRRFGAPAVTLGFLTVGVQTAINASAGMLRMPQRRFLPAVTLGALLWSVVYTTVGFTVVDAWLGDVAWWWAVVALAVVAGLVFVSRRLERTPSDAD